VQGGKKGFFEVQEIRATHEQQDAQNPLILKVKSFTMQWKNSLWFAC
jgi:hypothetical protein